MQLRYYTETEQTQYICKIKRKQLKARTTMAKGTGSTKSSPSAKGAGATPKAVLGGGKGIASGNTFSASAKITDFEGSSTLGGGDFSLMTKDGKYTMVIETSNFIENGEGWTMVSVGVRQGTGRVVNLINDTVETGAVVTESMGATYNNNEKVATRINNSMPYYAERVNYWIKNKV